jgi:two-component system sensor histidine kinase AlgZ
MWRHARKLSRAIDPLPVTDRSSTASVRPAAAGTTSGPLPLDSTRPGELHATSTGSILDHLPPAPASDGAAASAGFDVCHVGVVLRAVLAVHGVLALGTLFVASDARHWVMLLSTGAIVALPGTVLWLTAACGLKRPLGRVAVPWQWAAAIALGALAGAFGWSLRTAAGMAADEGLHWLPPVAAGGAIAAALFYWLRLRAQLNQPADATARLVELQSRIRPHFLFNTLNTAMALVRVDPARAEDVLADLSELFRVALMPGGESVSLDEEIELAKRYLEIEQVRFGSRLAVQWELDPQAGRARVPPLLLQPLVENAVRHGIEPSPKGGTIRVRTRNRRAHTVIVIDNTVSGGPSRPGHGLALRNVRERLALMHDVAAQFDARRDGERFRVQIVVPL